MCLGLLYLSLIITIYAISNKTPHNTTAFNYLKALNGWRQRKQIAYRKVNTEVNYMFPFRRRFKEIISRQKNCILGE